ncbi:MAG: hypothetical protein K2P63_04005, partial [Lachnospiraceae bacterium]|nr:hypothetical protein [Lachnospiraceae bacterium]
FPVVRMRRSGHFWRVIWYTIRMCTVTITRTGANTTVASKAAENMRAPVMAEAADDRKGGEHN